MAMLGGRGDGEKMVGERTDQEVERDLFWPRERYALKGVFGTHTYAPDVVPRL